MLHYAECEQVPLGTTSARPAPCSAKHSVVRILVWAIFLSPGTCSFISLLNNSINSPSWLPKLTVVLRKFYFVKTKASLCLGMFAMLICLLAYSHTLVTGEHSKILNSWLRASQLYINKIRQNATVCRYLFTAKSLYMFPVSIAPIIRST